MNCKRRLTAAARALALAAMATLVVSTPALAAHGPGATATTSSGNDVSYPQCGRSLPKSPAFGIAGLNDGLANTLNPCFGPTTAYPSYKSSELYWAVAQSAGTTSQPKASLYVNTADPGNLYNGQPIADWPTSSSSSDPYGPCTTTTVTTSSGLATVGADSPACAWQYGYDRAVQDATWLSQEAQALGAQQSTQSVPTQPGAYPWWLDVETANSWQSGAAGNQMNVADLQGMAAALAAAGAAAAGQVGIYSTASQWAQITGTPGPSSGGTANTLWGTPDWIPGARSLSGAQANCGQPSFTGGSVVISQWVSHALDYDVSCH